MSEQMPSDKIDDVLSHLSAFIHYIAVSIRSRSALSYMVEKPMPSPITARDIDDLSQVSTLTFNRTIHLFRLTDIQLRRGAADKGVRQRPISKKQIALVHVAKTEIGIKDELYRELLKHICHVETATDMDQAGFQWLMQLFTKLGFDAKRHKPETAQSEQFGRRANMASPAQIELIQRLWTEYQMQGGAKADGDLNAWLSKFHKISALRFVDAAKASKIINALRAMVARKSSPSASGAMH